MLDTTTTLASTPHQHFFNHERRACHLFRNLPPPFLYEPPSLQHLVTPFYRAPLLHFSEIGKGKTGSPSEVFGLRERKATLQI